MNMKSEEMQEKLKTISAGIREKNFLPFYYIYGNENYFITSIKKSLLKSFDDSTKLNTKIYNNDNFEINEVIKYIGNIPFMNEKKLIIFDNIDFFKNAKAEKESKDEAKEGKKLKEDKNAKAMIDALKQSQDINIVLYVKYETDSRYTKSYDKNNLFLNFFNENGIALNSAKLDEVTLAKYVQNHFKKSKIDIDKINVAYFIRTCGNDLNNLFNEADKLIAYMGDNTKVEKKDIDEIVNRKLDDKIYTLIDLYNSNKKDDALKYYGDLLVEGEKNGEIFAVFSYNYGNLIVCKDLMLKGKGQKEISDIMGIEPWRVLKLMNANKSVSIDTLEYKMKKITELSLARNTGNINEDNMVLLLMN